MSMKALTRCRGGGVAVLVFGALLLGLLATKNSLTADAEPKAHPPLPSDLAKIPSDGWLLVSGRVADFWGSDMLKSVREKYEKDLDEGLTKEFRDRFGLSLDQVERMSLLMLAPPNGPEEPLLFVRTVKPVDLAKVIATVKNVKLKKYKDQMIYVGDEEWTIYPLDKQSLAYGKQREINALIDHPRPKTEGDLASTLRTAAGKHSLVVGMNVKLLYDSVANQLPNEVEPFLPLFQSRSATFSLDFADNARASAIMTFSEEKDAKAAVKPAEAGLVLLRAGLSHVLGELGKEKEIEAKNLINVLKQLQEPLKAARIEQEGAALRAAVEVKIDAATASRTLVDAVQKVREAAGRTQGMNNLKQIALAMHNYADSMQGLLPAHAIYSKDGKPLLSWRVLILPYVEQDALFKQFHLNEAWDSEHNKKLLAQMPKLYASPQDEKTAKEHTTYYQGFFGKSAFFEGKQGLRFPAEFTDGTSNTLLIVEASKAVPWTKPEDIPFDPEKPLPKLGLPGAKYFLASLCDGSVRTISHQITKETLRSAITRNGGEVLGSDF